MRRERGEEWGLGFGGGEGRPGCGLYAAPPNGRIKRSRGAASTVGGRGGRVWGVVGGGPPPRGGGGGGGVGGGGGGDVTRPDRFSAWYWAAIGPPNFGPCFGPTRCAEVAAQALKGHRAGPPLSPIDRA
jgi:hypothetical protein